MVGLGWQDRTAAYLSSIDGSNFMEEGGADGGGLSSVVRILKVEEVDDICGVPVTLILSY